jgi:predicted nucleotidyltransferase
MDRRAVIKILQEHAPEFQQMGAASLSLFGSTARDATNERSDIDVAITFDHAVRGLYAFGALDRVRAHLRELLQVEVDVIPEPVAGPLKASLERDRVRVY